MIQGIEAANLDEVRELVAAGGYKDGRGDRLSGLAGPVCYPQTKVVLRHMGPFAYEGCLVAGAAKTKQLRQSKK